MKCWHTKSGTKIIRVLSGRSNVYLLLSGKEAALVDTGKISAFQTLRKNLAAQNIDIADISLLFLTHTHFDHCQAANRIQEESGCKIVVSAAAEDAVHRGYTKLPNGTLPSTKWLARLGQMIGKRRYGYEPFLPDRLITGDATLEMDHSKVKILETGGHSCDSISILVDDEIALVGDAMFGVFRDSVFPPYADDVAQMVKSWQKLLATGCTTFLPGHGSEVHRELLQRQYEKKNINVGE